MQQKEARMLNPRPAVLLANRLGDAQAWTLLGKRASLASAEIEAKVGVAVEEKPGLETR